VRSADTGVDGKVFARYLAEPTQLNVERGDQRGPVTGETPDPLDTSRFSLMREPAERNRATDDSKTDEERTASASAIHAILPCLSKIKWQTITCSSIGKEASVVRPSCVWFTAFAAIVVCRLTATGEHVRVVAGFAADV